MTRNSNLNSQPVTDDGSESLTGTNPSVLLIGSVTVLSVLNGNRITGAGVSAFLHELSMLQYSVSRAIVAATLGSIGAGASYGAEKFNFSRRLEIEDHE